MPIIILLKDEIRELKERIKHERDEKEKARRAASPVGTYPV